jgi:serine/threonine-protein kinase
VAAVIVPKTGDCPARIEQRDIFSFGAVLYELLCGSRAFGGHTTLQVVHGVLRDDPPALAAPPALERLVRRCLQKAPAQRFQTMAEVKAALEHSGRDLRAATSSELQPSIAVLPFDDMSAAKDHEWFSDGRRGRLPLLRVVFLSHIPQH